MLLCHRKVIEADVLRFAAGCALEGQLVVARTEHACRKLQHHGPSVARALSAKIASGEDFFATVRSQLDAELREVIYRLQLKLDARELSRFRDCKLRERALAAWDPGQQH